MLSPVHQDRSIAGYAGLACGSIFRCGLRRPGQAVFVRILQIVSTRERKTIMVLPSGGGMPHLDLANSRTSLNCEGIRGCD